MQNKKAKKEKQITEKLSQMVSGGKWLVQDNGTRVLVQAPTIINQRLEKR